MQHENINPNPKRSASQKQRILELLQEGQVLTPLDGLHGVGSMKLATRISELINEGHTEIQKKPIVVETKGGGTARVMSYFIAEPKLFV